ncbi:hypothetical protein ACT6QH_10800 [Xanthobacter sp. TB0139]|uniref:hypothetical protein n=1 Tax=Xanthobacter sp. TB0139 TaxID=3459178 RepID=UPI00403A2F2D
MRKLTWVMAAACLSGVLSISTAYADCQTDAMSLRQDLEAKGKALQAAMKEGAQPDPRELCPLFRSFATAEAKWAKFLTENKEWCQIPDEAITQANKSHKQTLTMRNRVCQAAEAGMGAGGPAPAPAQGSISSALGITTGYNITPEVSRRGGVFDTLQGNALLNK